MRGGDYHLGKKPDTIFFVVSKNRLSLFGVCLFSGGFWSIEKLGLLPEKKIIGRKTWAGPPTDAGIRYHACDMILAVHTDASYLSELGGKSRAAGHFYLTNRNDEDFNNGAILTLSSIIKHVMSSASEAELAALYYGCKQDAPIRITLDKMGHPQPAPTPITTNNITAQGLTMGTMMPKASKLNDQWFNCLNAATHSANSNIFGEKVFSIEPTMPANTTGHDTIKPSTHFMSLTATSCPHSKKPTRKLIGSLRGCVNYLHIRVPVI